MIALIGAILCLTGSIALSTIAIVIQRRYRRNLAITSPTTEEQRLVAEAHRLAEEEVDLIEHPDKLMLQREPVSFKSGETSKSTAADIKRMSPPEYARLRPQLLALAKERKAQQLEKAVNHMVPRPTPYERIVQPPFEEDTVDRKTALRAEADFVEKRIDHIGQQINFCMLNNLEVGDLRLALYDQKTLLQQIIRDLGEQ